MTYREAENEQYLQQFHSSSLSCPDMKLAGYGCFGSRFHAQGIHRQAIKGDIFLCSSYSNICTKLLKNMPKINSIYVQ